MNTENATSEIKNEVASAVVVETKTKKTAKVKTAKVKVEKTANEVFTEKSNAKVKNFMKKLGLVCEHVRHCVSQTDAMAYVGKVENRVSVWADVKKEVEPALWQGGRKMSQEKANAYLASL